MDPNGNTFWSRGIDTINPNGETERGKEIDAERGRETRGRETRGKRRRGLQPRMSWIMNNCNF